MNKNNSVESTHVRALTEDAFQLKIHLSEPDGELLEFYLDYQQLIQLIDQIRGALR